MSTEIRQSIAAVEQAMESLNQAFERHAEAFRAPEQEKELQKWLTAAQAMRDSGHIYLNWARHYAQAAGAEASAQGQDDADLEAFLDEGSDLSGDRPLL